MRVGIDIQSTLGLKTGIGYYTSSLLEEFKNFKDVDFVYYKNGSGRELNTVNRMCWENLKLPRLFNKDNLDIFHVPGFAGPYSVKKARKVITVHDLIGMVYPLNLAPISRFYWQRWLPWCAKNSDLIISVSENTKKDIVKFLKIPEDRIKVIYSAASRHFSPIANKENLRDRLIKYGISTNYILNVGTVEPRKNIPNLIKAFAGYLNNSGAKNLSLVIVGKKGWAYGESVKAAVESGIQENVVFCDYIDESDLALMYNLAELLIYPSLYEGFGLPILEAMSCSTPVVCSNVSSLPELAGGAAILIDPLDNTSIENGFGKVLSDSALKRTLSEKALKRSAMFSWRRTAEETVKAYKEAMGEKPR